MYAAPIWGARNKRDYKKGPLRACPVTAHLQDHSLQFYQNLAVALRAGVGGVVCSREVCVSHDCIIPTNGYPKGAPGLNWELWA